jgi:hypothetical protein
VYNALAKHGRTLAVLLQQQRPSWSSCPSLGVSSAGGLALDVLSMYLRKGIVPWIISQSSLLRKENTDLPLPVRVDVQTLLSTSMVESLWLWRATGP